MIEDSETRKEARDESFSPPSCGWWHVRHTCDDQHDGADDQLQLIN